MKVIIASNDVTADDVLAIALLAVATNKTPQVVRTDEAIQDALEDKNFDGDVLSSVIKYLEGAFPEGWQVPEFFLTENFSLDLARAIELIKETSSY